MFAKVISIWGKPINIYKFNAIPLQNMHLTKNGMLSLTTSYPKSYSDIGIKIIQNNVMLKNCEDACDGAYSVNFLNDFELLDLGSAFSHYLSLGTCALITQYAKHFHA